MRIDHKKEPAEPDIPPGAWQYRIGATDALRFFTVKEPGKGNRPGALRMSNAAADTGPTPAQTFVEEKSDELAANPPGCWKCAHCRCKIRPKKKLARGRRFL